MTLTKALARNILSIGLATAVGIASMPILAGCQQSNIQSNPGINHLKGQASPYLLDHAGDPVHWYPWGDEAFAVAKRENRPVFLSIGFAACHWCHVMHRQSFEDPATAKILNDNFVSIKVDREEMPYIDEVYCRAAQAIGGRGGWPLSVFLTPDKKPFFAGTYFPKTDMYGLPAFSKVLQSVTESWQKHRGDVDKTANELCLAIYSLDGGKALLPPDKSTVEKAGAKLLDEADKEYGGVLGARKFALPGVLALAMQQIVLDPKAHLPATTGYLAYVSTTLNQMASGGIRDQLHGGFFRYATDRTWHIPHFEKMLCDNALIAQSYLDGALLNGNSHWKAVGLDTLDFCLSEFGAPDGTFYGSSDADSGGQEGAFYTYTPEEISAALGPADGKLFCTVYSVSARPGARDRHSVLYFSESEEKLAQGLGIRLPEFEKRLKVLKTKLINSELIKKRIRPTVDKKAITAWNGLMISALVEGYKVSGDEKYLIAAKRCASFLFKNMCQGKWIHRIWADGKAEISGCLDDYAFFIRALLDLAEVESDPNWLIQATALNETVVAHFFSHHRGFYLTANNKEQALARTGCARDNGLASPAAIEIMNLVRLYEITGDSHLKNVIDRVVQRPGDAIKSEPTSYGFLLAALDRVFHQGDRLELLEGTDRDTAERLKQQIWQHYAPHLVSVVLAPKQFATLATAGHPGHSTQSIEDSKAVNSKSGAYFCNSLTKTCDKPLSDPGMLKAKLSDLAARGGL